MPDDTTSYLHMPLPQAQNTLDEDLPRLCESLEILDAKARQSDNDISGLGDTLTAEIASRKAAVGAAETIAREALGEATGIEAQARTDALAAHNASATSHDALVRRITVGSLSPVIGICQVETGGGSGLWFNCDAEGQPISPTKSYFDYHPVYSGLKRVLIDEQVMVEVPQFWTKKVVPASGPFAGKPCRIISPGQADGFKLYPAFMKNGQAIDRTYIGAYQATNEGGAPVKIGSRSGKTPIVSLDFPTAKTYCANRNTGGVSGFAMWDIYQLSALQQLILTEFATPDAQAVIGRGNVDSTAAVNTDYTNQPVWRGFVGLWGNIWQMVDGLDADTAKKIRLFKDDGSRTWVSTGFAAPAFDGVGAAYKVTLKDGKAAGYDFDDIFLPATTTTNAAAGSFAMDCYYGPYGSAGNVLYIGGYWNYALSAGLFTLALSNLASTSGTNTGCRLAKS